MDIFSTFAISASALKAQKIRLDTVSSNLANAETTSTPEGGPYKKKSVYFQSKPIAFEQHLDAALKSSAQ
ncbi:MAG: flagellar basal body rod protein FlgC, partial [Desulfofustis sp.]|nr:flagellar basal body rod protein FlgC [Desulfofustis sp.]